MGEEPTTTHRGRAVIRGSSLVPPGDFSSQSWNFCTVYVSRTAQWCRLAGPLVALVPHERRKRSPDQPRTSASKMPPFGANISQPNKARDKTPSLPHSHPLQIPTPRPEHPKIPDQRSVPFRFHTHSLYLVDRLPCTTYSTTMKHADIINQHILKPVRHPTPT